MSLFSRTRQAQEALERTRPHEADARVRVADNVDDLVAVYCRGIKAVVWERPAPQNVLTALQNIDFEKFANAGKIHYLRPSKIMPQEIQDDARLLKRTASKIFNNLVDFCMTHQAQNEGVSLDNVLTDVALPHVDGYNLRLTTTCSIDLNMGMEWYPGKRLVKERRLALYRLKKAGSVFNVAAIKKEYDVQRFNTFDVVALKGEYGGHPKEDELFHNEPPLKKGVVRMAYMSGFEPPIRYSSL